MKHIGLKDTRLISLDGEELVYPNKEIGQAHITNYSKITTRRQKQDFHLTLASKIEMIEEVPSMVQQSVEESGPECRFGGCWLLSVDGLGYQFTMQYYVDTPDIGVFRDRVHTVWVSLLKRLRGGQLRLAEYRMAPAFPE